MRVQRIDQADGGVHFNIKTIAKEELEEILDDLDFMLSVAPSESCFPVTRKLKEEIYRVLYGD